MRFEVVHAYLVQHCFFLPLPHVPVGIQNVAATSKKTKDPGLHKGNTPKMDWQLWSHSIWFENIWRFWAQLALCSPCCSLFNFRKIWEIWHGGSHCWSLPIHISFTSSDLHLTVVAVLWRWHWQFYFYFMKFQFCMIVMICTYTHWITWAFLLFYWVFCAQGR